MSLGLQVSITMFYSPPSLYRLYLKYFRSCLYSLQFEVLSLISFDSGFEIHIRNKGLQNAHHVQDR